jgi:hypothetical protein
LITLVSEHDSHTAMITSTMPSIESIQRLLKFALKTSGMRCLEAVGPKRLTPVKRRLLGRFPTNDTNRAQRQS